VGPDTAEFLSDQSSIEVRTFPGYYAYAVMLNSARPVFTDPAVRRALNLGVDRATIVQQGLRGRGAAADSPVWPRHWARDPRTPALPFDPAAASAMLAAHRAPVSFTCLVPANFSILERMALLVQQQLGDLGVRVRLESLPPDAFNRRIVTGDFDAVMLSVVAGPAAMTFHRFWHSPGPGAPRWNFWGYRNARADAALDAAQGARDDRELGEAIRRFEAAVREDPPAIFLAWNRTVQALSRRFLVPGEYDGRDAITVLNRWLLRPPGSGPR
jgi:peptide/nickel transport system substrate-binding protein